MTSKLALVTTVLVIAFIGLLAGVAIRTGECVLIEGLLSDLRFEHTARNVSKMLCR